MSDSLLYPAILKTDMQHTINHFDLWTDTHHGVECIDLRREFYDFLHGSETELPKGHQGIFRRMRRDTTGKLIPCLCLDRITREPSRNTTRGGSRSTSWTTGILTSCSTATSASCAAGACATAAT